MEIETKICTKCKKNLSISEFTVQRKKRKDGTIYEGKKPICKKCVYEVQIEYRKKNKEKLRIRDAEYHQTVKDKRRQQEIVRLSDPENRQKRREYIKVYKEKRRIEDPSFKLYESLRKRIWKCLDKKSNSSKEYLGCNIDFYQKWIEFTMENDMKWDNYGTLWNIDHVIPISTFDISDENEIKKAFNWKNTCARYANENFSKKNKINEAHNLKQKDLLDKFTQQQTNNQT